VILAVADDIIIILCFNEEERHQGAPVLSILQDPGGRLLLVDDGSSDNTEARLRGLQHRASDRIEVLALPENPGKAEAVRAGMQHAVATLRAAPKVNAVLGARMAVLGADIRRKRQLASSRPDSMHSKGGGA
jgi:glycosyltransferase involved in cell wall biosynthesis